MIYIFLAEGFEELEAAAPADILRRAGFDVKTVGIGEQTVAGSHGIKVSADITDVQISVDDMDMVILPGGTAGTKNLERSPIVRASINYCAQNGKYVAAICAAPSVLGHMGLLNGQTAICYPGYESSLEGAVISKDPVCVSGKYITGKGAGVAVDFALKIVEVLGGKEKSQKIRKEIQCM